MRETVAPFKPLKQKVAYPTSFNPLMYLLVGAAPKKCSLFYQHFSNKNMCLGPKKDIFSLFEAKRGGRKCIVSRIYEVNG
jgi:hypothetical protein